MTPFALQHLAICWAHLKVLHLDIPALPSASQPCPAALPLSQMASLLHLSLSLHDCSAGQRPLAPACAVDLGQLPPLLESLSLAGREASEADMACLSAAARLRHLRLLHCVPSALQLVHLGRALGQRLHTLVVKGDERGRGGRQGVKLPRRQRAGCTLAGPWAAALQAAAVPGAEVPPCPAGGHHEGLGSEALGALAAGLPLLQSLAVTAAPGADVAPLQGLQGLRHLVLDARCNAELKGLKGLRGLTRLRLLVLPVAFADSGARAHIAALQQAAPGCAVRTVTRLLQLYRGSRWFAELEGPRRQEWWRVGTPWTWQPMLQVVLD
jgi:hypothetical protein